MSSKEETLIRYDAIHLSTERTGEMEVGRAAFRRYNQGRYRDSSSSRSKEFAHFLVQRPHPYSATGEDPNCAFYLAGTTGLKSVSLKSIISSVSIASKLEYQLMQTGEKLKSWEIRSSEFNEKIEDDYSTSLLERYTELKALSREYAKLSVALRELQARQFEIDRTSKTTGSYRAATSIRRKDYIDILDLLQKQPLTVRDISETLNISVEEVRSEVKFLFKSGSIDKLDTNLIRKIFPIRRKKQLRNSDFLDSITHFTLTLKGYFQINPVFTIKR